MGTPRVTHLRSRLPQTVSQTRSKVEEILRNVSVYSNCILSVDGNNAEAKQVGLRTALASTAPKLCARRHFSPSAPASFPQTPLPRF